MCSKAEFSSARLAMLSDVVPAEFIIDRALLDIVLSWYINSGPSSMT